MTYALDDEMEADGAGPSYSLARDLAARDEFVSRVVRQRQFTIDEAARLAEEAIAAEASEAAAVAEFHRRATT